VGSDDQAEDRQHTGRFVASDLLLDKLTHRPDNKDLKGNETSGCRRGRDSRSGGAKPARPDKTK
jgi:hypothetical protein